MDGKRSASEQHPNERPGKMTCTPSNSSSGTGERHGTNIPKAQSFSGASTNETFDPAKEAEAHFALLRETMVTVAKQLELEKAEDLSAIRAQHAEIEKLRSALKTSDGFAMHTAANVHKLEQQCKSLESEHKQLVKENAELQSKDYVQKAKAKHQGELEKLKSGFKAKVERLKDAQEDKLQKMQDEYGAKAEKTKAAQAAQLEKVHEEYGAKVEKIKAHCLTQLRAKEDQCQEKIIKAETKSAAAKDAKHDTLQKRNAKLESAAQEMQGKLRQEQDKVRALMKAAKAMGKAVAANGEVEA